MIHAILYDVVHNIMQSVAYVFRNCLGALVAAATAVTGTAGNTGMASDEAIPVAGRLFSWLLRAIDVFSDKNQEIRTAFTNAPGLRIICI